MRAFVLGLAVASGSLVSSIAHADARAEAVALFDEGIKDMKAGKLEKACASFKRSNELIPDSGTKGSLARCYQKSGKLASSWLLWRELADTAPSADLRKDAAAQAAKLDARVPKFVVKLEAPTPGVVVTINGKPTDVGLEVPVPVDPGAIIARATAPGYQDWKLETTAAEGGSLVIEVPALVAIVVPVAVPVSSRPAIPSDSAKRRHKRHVIGGTVAGLGAGAVVVGGIFGVLANGKYSDAKTTCGGSIDRCAPDRVDLAQGQVDDARSAANLSSILFVAGGALVVTGAVLWISAPHVEKPSLAIAPTAGGFVGFVARGRF
jgi:hypothetical protein